MDLLSRIQGTLIKTLSIELQAVVGKGHWYNPPIDFAAQSIQIHRVRLIKMLREIKVCRVEIPFIFVVRAMYSSLRLNCCLVTTFSVSRRVVILNLLENPGSIERRIPAGKLIQLSDRAVRIRIRLYEHRSPIFWS